jgi:hypothetical protein
MTMHWGSFAIGVGAGVLLAVAAWCIVFLWLMGQGDE